MPDLIDFLPLRTETVDTIRARLDADVNAGIDPSAEAFIDTTPGGFYYDVTQALVLELERLWDMAANDMVAASFVAFAWGSYLDAHGETIDVLRKDAVAATGTLTFSGADGTIIPVGVEVSTIQTTPDEDPVSFETTQDGVIAGGTLVLSAVAVEPGTPGNVAANAASLLLSPVEGVSAVTNDLAFAGGEDVESDEQYRTRLELAWAETQGAGSTADYERWSLAYPGVGHVRVVPLWNGPGTVRVIVTDAENNPVATAVRDGLQTLLDPVTAATVLGLGGVTLPAASILVAATAGFPSAGRVFVADQLVAYTSVNSTHFLGGSGGTGTFPAGTPVTSRGEGKGLAPVGAIVTVDTPAILTVNIAATVAYADGYSADGGPDGTIPTRLDIEQALADYVSALPPGGDDPPGAEVPSGSGFVLLNKVIARFFAVTGVYNVSAVRINGVAADLAVSPLQVPSLGTVTLS